MDIIKNYLDNMFASLSDTQEVKRAKEEICQMMEDKYLELKGNGKSENEAIGIVIAEFGNLDEIKEELGQEKETIILEYKEKELRKVSLSQAKEYIESTKRVCGLYATSVLLWILSPAFLIFLSGLSEIHLLRENIAGFVGLLVLFTCIAGATALFIYSNSCLKDSEYLKEGNFVLAEGVWLYVESERKGKRTFFSTMRIAGVVLCICSVIPLLGLSMLGNDFLAIISVCFLLLFVSIGAALLTCAGEMEKIYLMLMKEGDFKETIRVKKKNKERLSSVYWCIVTAVYLAWSFWSHSWGFTWIIWPVAGVLYGAFQAILAVIFQEE